ncbi:NUDIX hydrolase [Streptomyces sp. NPDC058409]|uniref:NUDIX hydrolase n=1 Tax=Streptomyces sp. NPDC058409 TaxID=3346484 RepID=UPI00364646DB
MLAQVDELVTRSHSDGVTDLATASLIEHDAKFLLARTPTRDLDTPPAWNLPAGTVMPGETVVDGLHRILAQTLGYSNTKITAFFGTVDANTSFAPTSADPH